MRIGIFGGSFNPVHMGHYYIVEKLLDFRIVDRVIILPTFRNPLKKDYFFLPESLRKKMLQTTFEEIANVEISEYELDQQRITFTVDTLEHFAKIYASASLTLVLGADNLDKLTTWKSPERIMELSDIVVFPRPGGGKFSRGKNSEFFRTQLSWINVIPPNISATEIRNASSMEQNKQNPGIHPKALGIWNQYQQDIHRSNK